MSTAQIIYEQYKILPKKVQKELKQLIDEDTNRTPLLSQIEKGLQEVKLIRNGKSKALTLNDVFDE